MSDTALYRESGRSILLPMGVGGADYALAGTTTAMTLVGRRRRYAGTSSRAGIIALAASFILWDLRPGPGIDLYLPGVKARPRSAGW